MIKTSVSFILSLNNNILPRFKQRYKQIYFNRTMASLTKLDAPIAVQKPHKVAFGKVDGENRGDNPFFPLRYRDDPWFWLRDDTRKNEEVLDHLRKENAYTEEKN